MGVRALLAAACLAQACAAGAVPTPSLEDFYPLAHELSQGKPDLSTWRIACSRDAGKAGFVSLLVDASGQVGMAAYSEQAPVDVPRLFDARRTGSTRDWAWVFDRAGRGRIDYFAFHLGEQPVKPKDFRADFPKGRGISKQADADYLFAKVQNIFHHAADDNGDGRVDGVVAPVTDRERPAWVEGFAVLLSRHFDDAINADWLFRDDIHARLGPVPRNEKGLRVRPDPEEGLSPRDILPPWSAMLADFNRLVGECKLGDKLRRR